jgi:hypothetical protein
MALSLRLSKQLDDALDVAARLQGVSKSEFVRQLLEERLAKEISSPSAYELGKHLFGLAKSGRTDLVANSEQIVREKIHAKARRNRHGSNRRVV